MRDADLWKRIDGHPLIDRTGAADTELEKSLETQENWERSYAAQVIQEYKRFLYLSRVSPSQATPSEIIDIVWHLHMQDSAAYLGYCAAVFGELHHHEPCAGDEEMPRYQQQYEATLALYAKEFGSDPPEDIWIYRSEAQLHRDAARRRMGNVVGIIAGAALIYVFFHWAPSIGLARGVPDTFRLIMAAFFGLIGGQAIASAFRPRIPGPKHKSSDSGSSGCGGGCGGCG